LIGWVLFSKTRFCPGYLWFLFSSRYGIGINRIAIEPPFWMISTRNVGLSGIASKEVFPIEILFLSFNVNLAFLANRLT